MKIQSKYKNYIYRFRIRENESRKWSISREAYFGLERKYEFKDGKYDIEKLIGKATGIINNELEKEEAIRLGHKICKSYIDSIC